jgi:hypothetical protein
MKRAKKKLAPRKIIVGCGETYREITITDQAKLRLIDEIVKPIDPRRLLELVGVTPER